MSALCGDASRAVAPTVLSPEAVAMIDAYFERVRGAMLLDAVSESEDVVAELREHVFAELAASDGGAAAAVSVLSGLGSPEDLAQAYSEGGPEETYPAGSGRVPDAPLADQELEGVGSRLAGRVLGIPFEFRPLTARRIAHRWWNVLDRRLLVPRVWGIGWDVNLGAIAVLLGVVRPDDEDSPFASVPDHALLAAFAVPATVSLALGLMVAATYGRMPATVPMGWGLSGQANQYWDTPLAAVFVLAMSLVPTGFVAALFVRDSTTLARAVGSAVVTLLACISLATWSMAAWGGPGRLGNWPIGVGMSAGLVLPFLILSILSRIGRDVEMRRDLERNR